MLPSNFQEPAGFQWGTFKDAQGASIRHGALMPAGAVKGTVVIATGFRECIEKYFEVIRDYAARGFAVHIMDWRGQGGSDRYLKENPQKMYSEGYGEHIATLHQFATTIVQKSPGPLILSAHSMGAHIGLRYLREHDGVFDSAILTAPMVDVMTSGVPKPLARQMARFAKAGGILKKYTPGGVDWYEGYDVFQGNAKTSDPARFGVLPDIFGQKPELRMGDTTYGWAYHTFQSIDILRDESYLRAIRTPILLQVSGKDTVVDNAATDRACKFLPNCTRVDVAEAKHEIWMERDALRNPWLARVTQFLEARVNPPAPPPKKPKQNASLRPPG